jgi:hypothetical protein
MAKEPGLGAARRNLTGLLGANRIHPGSRPGQAPASSAGLALTRKRAKPDIWKTAIWPSMSATPAKPAAPAVRIRRIGRGSPPRTTRRSISSRQSSSTKDCRECVATGIGARRCRARSAWRHRAGFTRCGPKSAEPACPAMSNAKWREDDTACRFSAQHRELKGDGLKLRPLHAVAAWAKSSSNSSSIGENVLSGLVESVIGLRLP